MVSRRVRVVILSLLALRTLAGIPDRVQAQRDAVTTLAAERGAAAAGGALLAVLDEPAEPAPADCAVAPASGYADAVAAVRASRACRAAKTPGTALVQIDGDPYLVSDGAARWWPPIEAEIEARTGIPLQVGGDPPHAHAILPGHRLAGTPIWSLPTRATEASFDLLDGTAVLWLLLLGGLLGREWLGWRREVARSQDRAVARDAILQRLSHELRTPAASVRSLVDALDHADGPERAQFLGLVRSEAERLATGIDRLLQAARGEATLAVDPVPLDLAEWAEGVRARWLARVPNLALHAARPSPAVADPERLDEAVDALLDNARKYGGPNVTLSVAPNRVAVEDDGPGVPAKDRARVLEKFERVEGRVNDPGGHGLGLWAAGEVARAHRGKLALEGGNRFVLTLGSP
ncbi:MAG: sensor histidine kinase [Myxococcota bacterium]